MTQESKSAVFGLNWLQESEQADMSGSYDAEREVWTTNNGNVVAGALRTAYYTYSYTYSYTSVGSGGGYIDCDSACDAGCDLAAI